MNHDTPSKEHIEYIKKIKRRNFLIILTRIALLIIFILQWEITARLKIVDPFLVSQPSRIVKTMFKLINEGNFFRHIYITCIETIIGFIVGTVLGTLIAIILWWSDFLNKVLEPYLVVLNALPKIALGPILIFWIGNGQPAIIIIALTISLIVTIISVLSGFNDVDEEKIKLVKTLGANKFETLKYVVLPSNIPNIITSLKINVGLSWVGVIVENSLLQRKDWVF